MPIRSFADENARRCLQEQKVDHRLGWKSIERIARRKLVMLDAATSLHDLKAPPSNQLEALKHSRLGQHAIRINSAWRICFAWTPAGAEDVEIVEYHDEPRKR